jgi:hypothetical protein
LRKVEPFEGAEDRAGAVEVPASGTIHAALPEVFGKKWDFQVAITPVILKLIKRIILEGW